MMPFSDTWKIHRRNIKKITSTATSLAEFDRIQETETAHFLVNLFEAPERLLDHVRHETGCVILKIIYGYDTSRHKRDPLVDMAETTVAQFAEASVPGRWAVDTFPFCLSPFLCHHLLFAISNIFLLISEISPQLDSRNGL